MGILSVNPADVIDYKTLLYVQPIYFIGALIRIFKSTFYKLYRKDFYFRLLSNRLLMVIGIMIYKLISIIYWLFFSPEPKFFKRGGLARLCSR